MATKKHQDVCPEAVFFRAPIGAVQPSPAGAPSGLFVAIKVGVGVLDYAKDTRLLKPARIAAGDVGDHLGAAGESAIRHPQSKIG